MTFCIVSSRVFTFCHLDQCHESTFATQLIIISLYHGGFTDLHYKMKKTYI